MQRYVKALLVVLVFLLYSKGPFADNVDIKPDYYKKATKVLEENSTLKAELVSSMEKLEKALEDKIFYERMLKIINDVGNNMLLGYLKHEKIMPFVKEYQEVIDTVSKEKDISNKVINNLLLEYYRDCFKGQILQIFGHYSDLAEIYDRIFLDSKEVQKEGNQAKQIKIDSSTKSMSLHFMNNIIIDELKVLIPSEGVDTPFDLTNHLNNALNENTTYMETLLKAYTMTVYYHKAVDGQIAEAKTSKEAMCNLLGSLTMTGIQAYKIILETDSKIVAFAQYDKTIQNLLNKKKEEKEKVLKVYDEKIENLKNEIKIASGPEKELKENDLDWREHERSIEANKLENDLEQNRAGSEYDYNIAHERFISHKKKMRHELFVLYNQINDLINKKAPNPRAVEAILQILDGFVDIFQQVVSGPKITLDNIPLKQGVNK